MPTFTINQQVIIDKAGRVRADGSKPIGKVVGLKPGSVEAEDVYEVRFWALVITREYETVETFKPAELEAAG